MELNFYRISNPTSSDLGAATISQSKRLSDMFKQDYINVLRHRIQCDVVKMSDDNFIIWLRIPSTNRENVIYDIVVDMSKLPEEKTFLKSTLKIWSNDPSFTFNYTYVLFNNKDIKGNKNPLIPDYLFNKCSNEAKTKKPEIRNPYMLWHIERYFVYAKLHILHKGYLNPRYLEMDKTSRVSPEVINKTVKSQDEMIKIAKDNPRINNFCTQDLLLKDDEGKVLYKRLGW